MSTPIPVVGAARTTSKIHVLFVAGKESRYIKLISILGNDAASETCNTRAVV